MNATTVERAVLMTAEAAGRALDAAEFEALYELAPGAAVM
jgi:hypothetical protein